jgi:hypothetical protein
MTKAYDEFLAKVALAKIRRAKRAAKRKELTIGDLCNRTTMKEKIVRALGLLDRKINGDDCRLGRRCPAYRQYGPHPGTLGYHLIPQKRGDASRFYPPNVVWACSRANFGEMHNRDLYAEYHVEIFGQKRIDEIKAIARTTADYSNADLRELFEEVKLKLSLPLDSGRDIS